VTGLIATAQPTNVRTSGRKRPSIANIVALLNRYECPTPFHAVRARFMGAIASPLPGGSPVHAVKELWGGELPPFDTMEDSNHLLQVLVDGVWNRLTVHQNEASPFEVTRLQLEPTRKALRHYALVRQQEIDGFMDGLFASVEELDLPESARDAAEVLGEMSAMFAGAVALLDDHSKPATYDGLKGLGESLRALAPILEREIHTVILSCTHARREILSELREHKPTVH
jgi:hypothetical protein